MLFLAPLLVAVMMRSAWWDFKPAGYSNLGTLVQPPIALPAANLELQYARSPTETDRGGQWVLLYPFPAMCAAKCQRDVAGLRQVHIATGRNRSSVAIWLLTPEPTSMETQKILVSLYPEFKVMIDRGGAAGRALLSVPGPGPAGQNLWQSGQAFLLDPATNIIMRYTPDFDPNDINQDLDHLLKWSAKE
jgi:peroxiredoxin